jgi:hypothetical protein
MSNASSFREPVGLVGSSDTCLAIVSAAAAVIHFSLAAGDSRESWLFMLVAGWIRSLRGRLRRIENAWLGSAPL